MTTEIYLIHWKNVPLKNPTEFYHLLPSLDEAMTFLRNELIILWVPTLSVDELEQAWQNTAFPGSLKTIHGLFANIYPINAPQIKIVTNIQKEPVLIPYYELPEDTEDNNTEYPLEVGKTYIQNSIATVKYSRHLLSAPLQSFLKKYYKEGTYICKAEVNYCLRQYIDEKHLISDFNHQIINLDTELLKLYPTKNSNKTINHLGLNTGLNKHFPRQVYFPST